MTDSEKTIRVRVDAGKDVQHCELEVRELEGEEVALGDIGEAVDELVRLYSAGDRPGVLLPAEEVVWHPSA